MDPATQSSTQHPPWLDVVREQVASLKYGHVEITVHNSRVVQVETTARIRFNPPAPDSEMESLH
jgi:hypothetical protein